MNTTISIPKDEYDTLKNKASLFDHYIETEELSASELKNIKKALNGKLLTRTEFLKRHTELL
jgi:hypothetical protein